jgi:hypothetical protein
LILVTSCEALMTARVGSRKSTRWRRLLIALSILGLALLPAHANSQPSRSVPSPKPSPSKALAGRAPARSRVSGLLLERSLRPLAPAGERTPAPAHDDSSPQGREEENDSDELPDDIDDVVESVLARPEITSPRRIRERVERPVPPHARADLERLASAPHRRGPLDPAVASRTRLSIRLCRLTC